MKTFNGCDIGCCDTRLEGTDVQPNNCTLDSRSEAARARSMCNAGKLISETRFPPKRPTSNIGKQPCPSFGRVPCLQTNERKDLIAPPILFSPTFSPSPAKLLIQSFSNYTTRPRFSPRPLLLRTAALSFRRPPLPALPSPSPSRSALFQLFVSENTQFGR